MTCEIRWIDESGKGTPDENEAVAIAVCHNGDHEPSSLFPICQEHLNMYRDRNLDQKYGKWNWTFYNTGLDLNNLPNKPMGDLTKGVL